MYNQSFSQLIGPISIDGGDELEIVHGYPGTCKLVAFYVTPHTALAAHADNHQTVTIKKGAGGTALGTTTSDVGATYENAYVKGTAISVTLTGTGKNLEFAATDCLEIVVAEGGTTDALEASYTAVWQPVRIP